MQLSLRGCELLLLNLQGAETAVVSFRMQSSLEFLLRTHGEAEHDWTQARERASQVALVAENPLAKAGDIKRHGFPPWVGTIPWRRAWQPTSALLPGESHGQRSLAGCSPRGRAESDTA